jgi:hypothetical protein
VIGKHTLQFGFDFNRTWDADTDDGGADPNEAIDFGSPLGLYEFANLEDLRSENTSISIRLREIRLFLLPCLTTDSTCRTPSARCRS